jgi:hypothetical protein
MNFKKILLASIILFSCGTYAQELFTPTEVIQGTFVKTTISLIVC